MHLAPPSAKKARESGKIFQVPVNTLILENFRLFRNTPLNESMAFGEHILYCPILGPQLRIIIMNSSIRNLGIR